MIKIHLDTDLGGDIDDICALAMLLCWPDVDLTGITTVGENEGRRAGYVRYVLELEGRANIPVAAGADGSHGFYRQEPGLPPEEKYWPKSIDPLSNPLEEAIQLLKKSIEQGATIIGIGPYTNLYLVDKQYPGILMQAKLFLMGGYIYPIRAGFPNWGNDMDYNIQADVKSAQHVIENSKPTLIPISVTAETYLRRSHLEKLRISGQLGKLIAQQAEVFADDEKNEMKYGETCTGLPQDTINFQHDPLACAIALGWKDGVEIEELPLTIKIKDGWLTEQIDKSGKPIRVVTKVDGVRFSDFWIHRMIGS